jgi:hypothetical protein
MNTRNRKLFTIIFFSVMVSACSNQAKIISSSEDQVVVKAQPQSFTEAYDMAKKECEKNTRIAQYIPDGREDLNEVAFNCFNPNPEVVAEAAVDENSEEQTEIAVETESTTETAIKETPSEESSTQ